MLTRLNWTIFLFNPLGFIRVHQVYLPFVLNGKKYGFARITAGGYNLSICKFSGAVEV